MDSQTGSCLWPPKTVPDGGLPSPIQINQTVTVLNDHELIYMSINLVGVMHMKQEADLPASKSERAVLRMGNWLPKVAWATAC